MLEGNKESCMLLERDFKPLKALQKIPKSRCANLGRRDHCLVTRRDLTSFFITMMGKDLKNKTMAAKYVFSKISRGNVGNDQKGICICLQIDV